MTKSKTKIDKQSLKKTNPELVETIRSAKKNEGWLSVASALSGSRRNRKNLNLSEIDAKATDGEKVVVAGKVLSGGSLSKKVKISAMGYSESAEQKLKEAKVEFNYITDEIKSNPKGEGIRLLK